MSIRILIADDQIIVRNGLAFLLQNQKDISIVGEARNGKEAIIKTGVLLPDILLLDSIMEEKSSIGTAEIISRNYPNTSVIILTSVDEKRSFTQMFKLKIRGIINKNISKEELLTTVRTVYGGEKYFQKEIADYISESTLQHKRRYSSNPINELSRRERDVLYLLAEGFTNIEISKELLISPRTVSAHKTNIMKKLNIRSTYALARYAFEGIAKG